jgi:transcription antitermination factor NusG
MLSRGIECFLPSWTRLSQWRDRRVPVERPLFPGYIFARFPLSRLNFVRGMRGLSGVLGPANKPLAIEAGIIEALKRAARDPSAIMPASRPLAHGDRVTVAGGPLAGLTGVVERTKARARLVLSIDIIGRACAVELGAAEVFKAQ